jgi:hypothetical protein
LFTLTLEVRERQPEPPSTETEAQKYASMLRTIAFENPRDPPRSYYEAGEREPETRRRTRAMTKSGEKGTGQKEKQPLTIPKLVMADGDRRARKRKQFGLDPEGGREKGVVNTLHRKTPPRPYVPHSTAYRLRSATPVPRGVTPAHGHDPWAESETESTSDDGDEVEDESESMSDTSE